MAHRHLPASLKAPLHWTWCQCKGGSLEIKQISRESFANAVAKEPTAECDVNRGAGSASRKCVLHLLSSCQADDSRERALDRTSQSPAPKRDEVAAISL